MSRPVKKSPSVCTDLPLDNADIYNKLVFLKQLLRSCYGPAGRLKQIRNTVGGHVITTSASSLLLPAVSSSQPFINLIKSSILSHVCRFSDCGLFAAILCLSLIEQAKLRGLRGDAAVRVYDHLLGLCAAYLHRQDCGCKVKLDFCSSHSLIALSRSVILSKPACVLTQKEAVHVSRLAVQAFLLTVPCDSPGTVGLGNTVTVSVEGQSVLDSAVFPGLLLDSSDVFYLSEIDEPHWTPLRVAVFGVSLAGDLSELGDGIIEVHPGADIDSQVLGQLLELGKRVVQDEVKLFICQKVIHPVLQQYLRSHGVVVIERVGIAVMEPLTQLTGAVPMATLHATVPPEAYGKVSDLRIRQFGSKTMVHLYPAGQSVICTMVLCHRNETMLSELKAMENKNRTDHLLQVACQKTEHVLRLTLKEPSALLGGGCTETHLAAYLRNKSMSEATAMASLLGCSQTDYVLGVEAFCRSLTSVAEALEHDGGDSLIDLTHAHHWILPADAAHGHWEENSGLCGCGLVKSSPSQKWTFLNTQHSAFSPAPLTPEVTAQPHVLDSFTAKLNALQVAVETANLALDVRYIIQDMN